MDKTNGKPDMPAPTAHEIRLGLAAKQRMQKTKDKWVGFANRVRGYTSKDFRNNTESRGVTLGEEMSFTKNSSSGSGCIRFTFCKGTVFALGQKVVLVIYRGKIIKVDYPKI